MSYGAEGLIATYATSTIMFLEDTFKLNVHWISGFHGGQYEENDILDCNAV
jgi:hypothetical protein